MRRAADLLRAIAKAGPAGGSLAELAQDVDLPRSTAHRMLQGLLDEGLVERGGQPPRYRMGPLVFELSLTASAGAVEAARWRPVVERVAQRSGVTAYLMRRSGVEAVCLVKADGHSVMRFVPVDVGQRRLLGVGAGATALLAALEPAQAEQTLAAIAPGLAHYPRLDPDSVRANLRVARRSGIAISQGTVVDDGFGMGLVIPEPGGTPSLALSIAAHASIVTESRIVAWRKVLQEELDAATPA